jgi:hypothetical protein
MYDITASSFSVNPSFNLSKAQIKLQFNWNSSKKILLKALFHQIRKTFSSYIFPREKAFHVL